MTEAVVFVKPLVSIVVTSYNHAEYLDERMQSLLAQTYDNIEIYVVDDCSTDKSAEVLTKYQNNPKVHILLLQENGGYAKACNIGVILSRGDYIMFAECDDFSEPNHVDALMEKMLQNPSAGVAYSKSNMVDANGFVYGSDFDYREKLFQIFCSRDALIPRRMMQKYFLISCVIPNMSAAIIRRKYYNLAGGFDSRYKACADWDFWCRMAEHCDFFYITKPLNNFRNHPTTVRNTAGIQASTLEIFDILYNNYFRMKLTYTEKLKFKLAIGTVWGSQYKQNSINWLKSFSSIWLRSFKYDYFTIFYLFMWIAKRSFEIIVSRKEIIAFLSL
jgi:glycosyltransferase involved in cell wall biosynthesis